MSTMGASTVSTNTEHYASLSLKVIQVLLVSKLFFVTRVVVSLLFLTTLLGLIAPKGLDTNGTLGPMLGVHPLQLTDHNTGISLLLPRSAWVLLSPSIACRETRPTA